MYEIEVKIFNINKDKIEKRLISLGARKIFMGVITSSYFDFKDKALRDNKQYLRLRKVGNRIFLTFKNPISDNKAKNAKINKEYEIEVSDFHKTKKILESLGLREWLTLKKDRTSYVIDNVRFEFDKYIDQYSFIPEFLEIEANDVKTLYDYVRLLSFKKEDCVSLSILDIIKNKRLF